MNILIVEDNPMQRKLLNATLAAEGHQVIQARDGVEALASLARQKVDAIISDILMPNMDGYRLCYEVRHDERWRQLPFMFYTSTFVLPADQRVALALGADAYLAKPASTREILAQLDEICAKNYERQVSPSQEQEVLKAYSQRLVAKLEERNDDLEKRTAELEQEIEERKRVEEANRKLEVQLRLSQKMDALGTLAAGIAHEFNNLIPCIAGNAELALQDLPAGDPIRLYLEEIKKASKRAKDLVNRILAFGRKQPVQRQALKLQPVVEEALKLLRVVLPAMIEIRSSFPGAAPSILADPAQIHQIIINLGVNAGHAMNDRGVLDVYLDTLDVNAELALHSARLQTGPCARLTITDSGCGMDPATLERIFEPFFTTKPQGQGTGLGLAIVDGIMKTHEGAITVESHVGQGTIFQLYFPAVAAEISNAGPVLRQRHGGCGERILFVDDEEALVKLATRALSRLTYHVSGFSRGDAALEALRAAPDSFDLLVTDLSMPGMLGMELARRSLEIRPNLPVIIMTGYVRPGDMERAQEIGVRDLILKPNTVEELGEILHRSFADIQAVA